MKERYYPKIGDVLIQRTCDAIETDLNGNSKEINPHNEHWLIEDMGSWGFKLYNLDTQRVRAFSRAEMNIALASELLIPTDIKA